MTNIKNKKAFSLIELSIVLLIIGIIIAGITQSTRLIAQFRLSTARSMTQSSPVPSVKDLVTWLETTSIASFADSETDNATDVTTWYDLNPSTSSKYNATGSATTTGKYTTACINGVPCLRFDGTNDVMTFATVPPIISSSFTVFVVEQKRASTSAMYYIGGTDGSTAASRLTLGYATDTSNAFNLGGTATTNYTATNTAYSSPTPFVHCYIHNDAVGKSYYFQNRGTTVTTLSTGGSANTTSLAAWTGAQIGAATVNATTSYYNGDIGEIIIYSRALKAEERQAVQDYLAKKWRVTLSNT